MASHRRRSSFHNRLSIRDKILVGIDLNSTEEKGDDSNVCSSTFSPYNEDKELDKYIAKLKKEKSDWKALQHKLKIENRELKEKPTDILSLKEGWAFLTNEDKQFLSERPDYAALGNIIDECSKTVALRQRFSALTIDKAVKLLQEQRQLTEDVKANIINQITHSSWEHEEIKHSYPEDCEDPSYNFEEWMKLRDDELDGYFSLDIDVTETDTGMFGQYS